MRPYADIERESKRHNELYGYQNALIWVTALSRSEEEVKSYLQANIDLRNRFLGRLDDVDGYIAALTWVLEE